MRTEQSYPTPIKGVSTLTPRNRLVGQAALQENFRSDPINKLTRRPPMEWSSFMRTDSGNDYKHHQYKRGDDVFDILVDTGGIVTGFKNGVSQTVSGNLTSYLSSVDINSVKLNNINDTTFVLNREKTVTKDGTLDELNTEKVAHINVVAAMNYGETLTVTILTGAIRNTISYSIPLVGTSGNFDAADQARATNEVASQIAALVTAAFTGTLTAIAYGSSVALWWGFSPTDWVEVEVETGRGDGSIVAVNSVIEKVDGLPLYAVNGTRITVKPNPTSDKGTYYLEAVATDPAAVIAGTPASRILQEVVWTESRSPTQQYNLTSATMPHEIVWSGSQFDIAPIAWDERLTGDDDSVKVPSFVGKTISALGYFQKRLVLVSDDEVSMTETDNIFNFWKASAVQLLVTDPINISSSAVGINKLQSIVTHNRDLLVIASNGQFKVDGTIPATPQTVSMPQVSSYSVQTFTDSVSMGSDVYLPLSYGDSSGLQIYSGKRNTTQDIAKSISDHVVDYVSGRISVLAANPNIGMLALVSEDVSNEIIIYETSEDMSGKQTQASWSKWILPATTEIINLTFDEDALNVVCKDAGNIILKKMEMHSLGLILNTERVYLDNMVRLDSSDGLTATVPTNYNMVAGTIIVAADGTEYPLSKVTYTEAAGTITFDEDISGGVACKIYMGEQFSSKFRPTRPYRRDDQGIVVTSDRLRVAKFILNVDETVEVNMAIISDYSDFDDQEFNSRYVGGAGNLIGEVTPYSGDVKFSYSMNADLSEVEFYTDGYLGLTISGISWAGNYYQASRRM